MARLTVDFERCTGHGRCYSVAEDLLTYDEEGFVTVRHGDLELTPEQIGSAEAAAAACPEGAMTVVLEDGR